ncbi:MAG: oxidoreductase [Thermodesulfobacteriota bacterium]
MDRKFNRLFESIKIGEIEIRNRIAMAPMGIGGLVNLDGSPGPRAIDYYVERARGEVGLIITSFFKVENVLESFRVVVPSVSRHAIGPFAELAEAIHSLGAKIFVQLTAGFGRVVSSLRLQGQPVSASPIPHYWNPRQTCRELKTEEVEQLVKAFGDAAEVLAAAGVDGVELHGHEGYLFDQFTTALWNRRTDKYGGDLEGRLMLPFEVLKEIKGRVGAGFVVQYRFGLKHYVKALNSGALPGEQFIEAGRDIEEGLQMARMLEAAGFDSLHVDAGCYDSWYWAHPPVYQEPGFMVDMAAAAKKVVRIPVIAVGKLANPDLAEKIIAEGKADMVAIGTGLLTDPFWVKKVREGDQERIRPCIGCYDGCMGRITRGKPLSCAVNPATGRERFYRLERAESSRKVMVVGGGPAGLEAARVASMRGHRVVLYEKDTSLGGHLLEASVPNFKKDLATLLGWYKKELTTLNLDIKTGLEVSAELIRKENPDVTILATGSVPIIPNIPGVELEKVSTANDLFHGKKKAQGEVLVVGGGLIGCETALWLAQQGKKVTIVEILGDLMIGGIPVQHMNRLMLLDLLKFHRVEIFTNTSLLEITQNGVDLLDGGSERRNFPADTIVLAVGLKPDRELYQTLEGQTPNLYAIGDSRKAQNIMNSIWDAYEVARMI